MLTSGHCSLASCITEIFPSVTSTECGKTLPYEILSMYNVQPSTLQAPFPGPCGFDNCSLYGKQNMHKAYYTVCCSQPGGWSCILMSGVRLGTRLLCVCSLIPRPHGYEAVYHWCVFLMPCATEWDKLFLKRVGTNYVCNKTSFTNMADRLYKL